MAKKGRNKNGKKPGKSSREVALPKLTFETDQLPDEFVRQLEKDHPKYARGVLEALSTAQPPSIRLNPHKLHHSADSTLLSHLPVETDPVPWEPMGRYLTDRPSFTLDPLFHAGLYYVQEASSMTIGAVVRQIKNQLRGTLRVLDLSAAPGGKSTHLASVLSPHDLLVCNEVIRTRATILTENMIKWGAPNVILTCNDPDHFTGIVPWFDMVVVDAPCSGEGLFRKDPAAIAHWSEEAVGHCSLRQNRILDAIWPVVRPGGFLIYSTCTYNQAENDHQIERLLSRGDATSYRVDGSELPGVIEENIITPINKITGNSIVKTQPEQDHSSDDFNEHQVGSDHLSYWMYRCMPGQIRGEGLTFSVVHKSDDAKSGGGISDYYSKNKLERCEPGGLATFLDPDVTWTGLRNQKREWIVPEALATDIIQLSESLNIIHAGIEAGDVTRPPHGLAMSSSLMRDNFPEIELDKTEALNYLRRESIPIDRGYEGVHLMSYQGIPIGFGKAVKGRLNNLYPMEWRIRMR